MVQYFLLKVNPIYQTNVLAQFNMNNKIYNACFERHTARGGSFVRYLLSFSFNSSIDTVLDDNNMIIKIILFNKILEQLLLLLFNYSKFNLNLI